MKNRKIILFVLLYIFIFNTIVFAFGPKGTVSIVNIAPVPTNVMPKIKIFSGYDPDICQEVGLFDMSNVVEQFECFIKKKEYTIIYKKETSYSKDGYIRSITIYYD